MICGVDEAGRGPLAGKVYAAAVILGPAHGITGLADSKILTETKREQLFELICERALACNIAYATVEEIDRLNILQATMLAMARAVDGLKIKPSEVLIDGNRMPKLTVSARTIVKGDALIQEISAASILAKVSRDHELMDLDALYPQYGFALHKGYPTAQHLSALKQFGVTPEHRRSFRPVREQIEATQQAFPF